MLLFNVKKRLLIGCLIMLSSLAVSASGQNQQWNFRVFLDEKPIGSHQFSVQTQGNQRQITGKASFQVKFLGLTAYSYQHNSQESWQGNCVQSLQTTTNDNGDRLSVNGQLAQQGFAVRTRSEQHAYPACVRTFAYWDLDLMRSPQLLNTQTGKLTDVRLQSMGRDKISVAGQEVNALRYRLTGKALQIDLWYSDQKRWLALESVTPEGRRIRYRLM